VGNASLWWELQDLTTNKRATDVHGRKMAACVDDDDTKEGTWLMS
jgi:hypothetical protein